MSAQANGLANQTRLIPKAPLGNAVKDFLSQFRVYRRAASIPDELNRNGVLQQSLGSQ